MSHFLDDRATLVTEALDADLSLAGGVLARLDGYPAIKVVLRVDRDPSHVAVVSGGGAGHEPAHAGFVGDGMLTAAVSGEVFASPSVDAVLAAILVVTGDAGCLLVVKSYTGDRLNFGLAAEKARALGKKVEMVIVGDDVALPPPARPRGIAGALFVHKVAGHLARAGGSLAEVKRAAGSVAHDAVSLGVALSSCSVPGQPTENRIAEGQMELGLGIHGEPGAKIVPLAKVSEVATTMVAMLEEALAARGPEHARAPVAVLVNDLGGTPALEMSVATAAVIGALRGSAKHEVRLVVGPTRAMTSLAMNGFSVTLVPIADPAREEALRSPVGPRAWLPARAWTPAPIVPLPDALRAPSHAPTAHPAHRRLLERACQALVHAQAELDALDAKVGDGDTGTTLATAARAILADLDQLPLASLPELFAALSERLSRVMGGSSGILLSIFTAAVGTSLAGAAPWATALGEGVRRLQEYGGAKPGDRTLIDALVPAIDALGEPPDLAAAARGAEGGAARTASMVKAGAGRSSYVREESLRGVPDPGASAVAAVFAALAAR